MRLAIVDDDSRYSRMLQIQLQENNLLSDTFNTIDDLLSSKEHYHSLLLDLRLSDEHSVERIVEVKTKFPQAKVFIITGYGSIPTAVKCIQEGADEFLTKPISMGELLSKLELNTNKEPIELDSPTLYQKEKDYIDFVMEQCDGNISQAAKKLGIHRQSLQRKLKKMS
jgi:two-component system response regulator RegA